MSIATQAVQTPVGELECGRVYELSYLSGFGRNRQELRTLGYWTGDVDYSGRLQVLQSDGRDDLSLMPSEITFLRPIA